MKKTGLIMLIAAFSCTASFAGNSHKAAKQKIAFMAIQDFRSDFPQAQNAQWNRDQQYSEATFMENGVLMHAFYDWDGELVGTTHDFGYNNLPAAARKTIAKQYKNYTIERSIVYNDNEDNLNDLYPIVPYENDVNYFVSLKKKDQSESIILQVTPDGDVSFFQTMR